MCREDPELRITAEEAHVRFLWLSASLNSSDLYDKLISRKKRSLTWRAIRKCERVLHIQRLWRETGLKGGGNFSNPILAMGASGLPVHAG